MGLKEDGAKRAAELNASRNKGAAGLSSAPYQPQPWLDELVDAVRARVAPVNFFIKESTTYDRTPIMKYQRATSTYRYIGARWVILGTGAIGEHGPMTEGFSLDERRTYSRTGDQHFPSEGKGRNGMECVNLGLRAGPMRLVGEHMPEYPCDRSDLAALAVHLLASNGCAFPQPGVIHIGSFKG